MENFPLNLLSFPLWWYAVGGQIIWQWYKRQYYFGLHKTGLLLFARHMNEPLYGDYSKTGIVLSFFIRIFILIYKIIVFLLRLVVVTLLALLFLAWLPGVLIMIIFQLFHYA
jgi:hypothetical protein